MKIKILNQITVAPNCRSSLVLEKGQEIDLSDDLACSLISSGDAELVKEVAQKSIEQSPENKMLEPKLKKKKND